MSEYAEFLVAEAALLDDNRLLEWLDLLTPDIDYRVPVRIVRERGSGPGFSDSAYFMNEDLGTLRTRVTRLDNEFAWAENPPTRTRRLVGNVRARDAAADGDGADVEVRSNLAVFCYRGDDHAPTILTGERHDAVRRVDGSLRLARRVVHLDSTVLGLQAFSIFL